MRLAAFVFLTDTPSDEPALLSVKARSPSYKFPLLFWTLSCYRENLHHKIGFGVQFLAPVKKTSSGFPPSLDTSTMRLYHDGNSCVPEAVRTGGKRDMANHPRSCDQPIVIRSSERQLRGESYFNLVHSFGGRGSPLS